MSGMEQVQIVNEHLVEYNLFNNEYDRYMYFYHQYDSIPGIVNNCNLGVYRCTYIPALNVRYYFNDRDAGVSGYIIWYTKSINVHYTASTVKTSEKGERGSLLEDNVIETTIPILKLVINKPVNEYMTYIQEKRLTSKNTINLYFCHLSQGTNTDYVHKNVISTYASSGNWKNYFRDNYAEKECRNWIDTFFHPYKQEIWTKLKTIHFDPESICALGQYPQASYCLYGPPGTGKSTLVYRVAKALGRGIVSVNLCGINKAQDLRKIITGTPVESSPHGSITSDPERCIIVLDELDKALVALKNRSDLRARMAAHRVSRNERRYGSDGSDSEGSDGDTEPINIEAKSRKSRTNMGVSMETNNVGSVIADCTEMSDDLLTVDSLLDIIQGSCANPNAIIFAITNKYEEIRALCPRLFRDGRFKPVYFGYPSRTTLDEITRYYMGRSVMDSEFDFIPDTIRISTARLVNRAVDLTFCFVDDKQAQFSRFMEHLRHDLENYKLSETFCEYEMCSDTDLSSINSLS
jgi:DNA polymerase III delta prime subunit